MANEELNTLKTDVAVIKKDIKQIDRVFNKVDGAIEDMSELHKIAAVQDTILENTERRLVSLENNFVKHGDDELAFRKDLNKSLNEMKEDAQIQRERRHKEVLETLNSMNSSVKKRLEMQDERVRALENWRWWTLGASAGLIFVLTKYNMLMSFFS